MSADHWLAKEGRKRLEEAMKRLNLDESRIRSKNLVNLGLDYLISEKAKVKNELKKYDTEFSDLFNRMPNKYEKEVLRPIYMYYKNLKTSIDSKANLPRDGKDNKNGTIQKDSRSATKIENKVETKEVKKPEISRDRIEPTMDYNRLESKDQAHTSKVNNNTTGNYIKRDSREIKEQAVTNHTTNDNSNNNIYSFNNVFKNDKHDNRDSRDNRYEKYDNELRIEERYEPIVGIGGRGGSANNSINYGNNQTRTIEPSREGNKRSNSHSYLEPKKIYTKQEQRELEKEYNYLLKEQSQLKERLQKFQKEFQELNNRKIKYHKDIAGVDHEYQTYKINREKINEIQMILTDIKLNKK
jgi:hypothetical protein